MHTVHILVTILVTISSCVSEEVNLPCLYGENCELCPCDISRCLVCSENNYCECIAGMHYDGNNQSCILNNNVTPLGANCPGTPSNYGEYCNNLDPNCKFCAQDLECKYGLCSCKEGSYYKRSEKQCYVYPGEKCVENPQCMENSNCFEGVCQCDKGFLQDGHRCFLGYNSTCRQLHKCHQGVHLDCVNQITIVYERKKKTRKINSWKCKCMDEGNSYVWSKSLQRCISLHSTSCDPNKDLCVVNSFCNTTTSKCECSEGFAPWKNRCLHKCSSKNKTLEICGPFKVCTDNVCTCELKQMVYDDCGECRMPLGHSCGDNYTCDIGLTCSASTCGKCDFPDSPTCTSSGAYFKFIVSNAIFSLFTFVIS